MLRLVLPALVLALLSPFPLRAEPSPDSPHVNIVEVTDGDTVRIQLPDGTIERFRLIGIDAPESVDPTRPPMCYSSEASTRMRELALGREAILEMDLDPRDRFGRMLGYLWLQDDGGEPWMLNERLAAEGYAVQLTIQPNSRYADRFAAAVESARLQGLGLWLACVEPSVAAPEPEVVTEQAPVVAIAPQRPSATPTRVVLPTATRPTVSDGPSTGGRFAPSGEWDCPSAAPIKGNRQSMIYHMPGQQAYNRTKPEDCFSTESTAVAAGYRRALR